MQLNPAMLSVLFNPINPGIAKILLRMADAMPEMLDGANEKTYSIDVFNSRTVSFSGDIVPSAGLGIGSTVAIHFYRNETPLPEELVYRFDINMSVLSTAPQKYSLYSVKFAMFDEQYSSSGRSLIGDPLSNGYLGITKRHPIVRFQEHRADAYGGKGHILHKTWGGIVKNALEHHVVFRLMGQWKTLDEAYFAEETMVDEFTLSPKGLNAIPGGYAGIRMMHKLRLLGSDRQVSIEDRDRALVRLETESRVHGSPCAHYRSGHFRNLPTGKITWVRSCWVNPVLEAA